MIKIIIMILILSNCNKNVYTLSISYKDINNDLLDGARSGDIDKVTSSLNRGAYINYQDSDGEIALTHTSRKGNIKMVSLLIEERIGVNIKDYVGSTALMYASHEGHIETVKLLIGRGAKINIKDNYGHTTLMLASLHGYIEIVSLLIEKGPKINYINNSFDTALIFASQNGHTEVVKILIEKGADINYKDRNSKTALMYVAEKIKDMKDLDIRDKYVNIAYILINSMINYYSFLKENSSCKIGILYIPDYIQLLEKTKSLPRDLFIEVISNL